MGISPSSHLKITVLGHACMLVEASDVRLLVDPWLVGSCYWRSWWNYPEVKNDFIDRIKPTHIYLSHLHWDHYHGPTLRKFYDSDPVIILPKAATKRMKIDMESDFKFTKIVEVIHGKDYCIGSNFAIASFQFNPFFVDSALVIRSCGINILNANDCKVFGFSLRQIISKYKKFDFVFRSHSSASPDPYCVEGVDPNLTTRKPDDYTRDFIAFAEACNARYAVPFASSHVYLHKGSEKYNAFYNSPASVRLNYPKYDTKSQCILMPAMSSWSNCNGFDIYDHNYEYIYSHINQMRSTHADSLEREYNKINKVKANRNALAQYFSHFCTSLPWFLPRIRFGFFLTVELDDKSAAGELIIVDTKKGALSFPGNFNYQSLILSDKFKLSFILKTYPHVINDCVSRKMFNTFAASKLLRVFPFNRGVSFGVVFTLLDLYENDGLPLWMIFAPRQFLNRLSRWREFFDIFYMVYIVKFRRLPLFRLWWNLIG